MLKGPQGQSRPADVTGDAVHIAKIATGEIEKTTLKKPAKRKSGLAGEKAFRDSTTEGQREKISRKVANARWK